MKKILALIFLVPLPLFSSTDLRLSTSGIYIGTGISFINYKNSRAYDHEFENKLKFDINKSIRNNYFGISITAPIIKTHKILNINTTTEWDYLGKFIFGYEGFKRLPIGASVEIGFKYGYLKHNYLENLEAEQNSEYSQPIKSSNRITSEININLRSSVKNNVGLYSNIIFGFDYGTNKRKLFDVVNFDEKINSYMLGVSEIIYFTKFGISGSYLYGNHNPTNSFMQPNGSYYKNSEYETHTIEISLKYFIYNI